MNKINSIIAYEFKKHLWPRFETAISQKARKRIINSNFSLITSNCIGGVMYHLLAMSFDSPTINLYIRQPDFCKFCSDLQYYLSQELRFFPCDMKCPCAHLGKEEKEITIQFEHYKTPEEATRKWEERKKRIHWDNLYIILNDGNGLTQDDVKLLEKCNCKRKIVFTSKKRPEIEDSFVLNTLRKYNDAVFVQLKRDPITGYRAWEKEFDFVAWLNGNEHFRND